MNQGIQENKTTSAKEPVGGYSTGLAATQRSDAWWLEPLLTVKLSPLLTLKWLLALN